MKLFYALLIAGFQLGMSLPQARAACPKPLMTAYEKLHIDTHFVCDDGVRSTVLIFDAGKLSAIVDLKYFVRQGT
jgi:hypothetical protein